MPSFNINRAQSQPTHWEICCYSSTTQEFAYLPRRYRSEAAANAAAERKQQESDRANQCLAYTVVPRYPQPGSISLPRFGISGKRR